MDAEPAGSSADLARNYVLRWQRGERPDLDSAVRQAGSVSAVGLLALVRADQALRWRAGEPILAEDYFRRYPTLRDNPEDALVVILGEAQLREARGEIAATEAFISRFPEYADALLIQIPLNRVFQDLALGMPGTPQASQARQDQSGVDTFPREVPALSAGQRVGAYELLGELGRGGMGVVYKARQEGLNRTVALKMILAGAHAGPDSLARFRAEAETLARLQHPHVVQVYEVSAHDGLPYFAMEFCPGGALDRRLAGTPLPPRQAAELAETLARAVQAAHDKGIVHRDLKPANVLLTEGDWPPGPGKGGQAAIAKITDFGLAKRVEGGEGMTQTGAVVGTPSYMAPEQAEGKKAVGSPADVYSLGAVFYELLTGRPPFRAATPLDTMIQVLTDEPVPPCRLQPKVPRDLETVCLKCLEKDPRRRYASAAALAEDLRRWQAGEPVEARPVGRTERVAKWVRRNPVVAALLALVILVTAGGTAGIYRKYLDAEEQADIARNQTRLAEEREELAENRRQEAEEALKQKDQALGQAREQLAANAVILAQAAWGNADAAAAQGHLDVVPAEPARVRNFEWHYLRRRYEGGIFAFRGHTAGVNGVAFSPDGKHLATASNDHTAQLWDAHTGARLLQIKGHSSYVYRVDFSPDGTHLATASADTTARVWDARTGAPVLTLRGHANGVWSTAFSPDGKYLATASHDHTARVWDARTGALVLTLRGHTDAVLGVAFSPDGTRLATASQDRTARLWDARTGAPVLTLGDHSSLVKDVAFSPDGTHLATASADKTVRVWNANTGAPLFTLRGHTDWLFGVAFSPDGARLATASSDRTVRLWDARSGASVLTLGGHAGGVTGVAFSPDGKCLATTSHDRTARLWDTRTSLPVLTLQGHSRPLSSVTFSPDGKRLATASFDTTARVWDAHTGMPLFTLSGFTDSVVGVAFSPDGTRLATAGWDRTARLWDARTGAPVRTLEGHTSRLSSVAFSPDGTRLATASRDRTARLWDTRTGAAVLTLRGHADEVNGVAFSPDGKCLATASRDNRARLWDAHTGILIRTLEGHTSTVSSVAFSPDGTRLATAGHDHTARLWDARTGTLTRTLKGHTGPVFCVAFSPDGTRLATASQDYTVRLWDTRTGATVLPLNVPGGWVDVLAFSPDGTRLATAHTLGAARLWDARPGPVDAIERGYREWATRPEPDWHAAEAGRLDRAGATFAADFHLRRLLEVRPRSVVLLLRGRPFRQHGDSGPLALAAYDAAAARETDNAALLLRRALVRSRLGQFAAARADLTRAAERNRQNALVMLAWSLVETRAGRAAQAHSALQEAQRLTTVPALSPQRGLTGERYFQDPTVLAADLILAVEEELRWQQQADLTGAAIIVAGGGSCTGPFSAAQALLPGLHPAPVSVQDAAVSFRLCGLARCGTGDWKEAVEDLSAALALVPADAVARRARARASAETGSWDQVVSDCTACLKGEPGGWELWFLRGLAQQWLRKPELALPDLSEALARGGEGLAVRRMRAVVAFDLKKWDLAAADYTEVVRLAPEEGDHHLQRGRALYNQGKLEEALTSYRKALVADPGNDEALSSLALVLERLCKWAEAEKAYRDLLAVDPGDARANGRLATVTLMAALEPKLPAFLKGELRPRGNDERLALATLCRSRRLYCAAAGFFAEAFAHDPRLADDLTAFHRYNAACYAALAATGQGEDAARLDDEEKARLRKQALTWLRADLVLWQKRLAGDGPRQREEVAQKMRHWQQDSDLAGLRDPAAVAKMPAEQREECKKLWAEVATALRKAQGR